MLKNISNHWPLARVCICDTTRPLMFYILLLTLMRNVKGSTKASPWYLFGVTYCTNDMLMVLLYIGLYGHQYVYAVASCCPFIV